MSLIIFRHLSIVAPVEELLRLQACGLLPDEDAEELAHLIDDASRALFGITQNDTLCPSLPEAVGAKFDRAGWEANFEMLGRYERDPNAHWSRFGLDLCCSEGRALHCLELFGRQLVCALDGIHPKAVLAFANREIARAA